MRPTDIQLVGNELAIRWEDASESFIPLPILRRCCPCAGCGGERDIFGNLMKGPHRPLGPGSFEVVRLVSVGGYAVQPIWRDGHAAGLYSFEYLRRIAEVEQRPPES
jgi:DUF971 family protein